MFHYLNLSLIQYIDTCIEFNIVFGHICEVIKVYNYKYLLLKI